MIGRHASVPLSRTVQVQYVEYVPYHGIVHDECETGVKLVTVLYGVLENWSKLDRGYVKVVTVLYGVL
jgi:hypothetical protein